jgi:hypothetical protein
VTALMAYLASLGLRHVICLHHSLPLITIFIFSILLCKRRQQPGRWKSMLKASPDIHTSFRLCYALIVLLEKMLQGIEM